MALGLGLRDIVFDVDPATPRKKGTPTPIQFLDHVYCGQMAGWMKTQLGTEADLGPSHIVLDGSQLPVKGHSSPPLFGPCLLWPRLLISATAELLFVFIFCCTTFLHLAFVVLGFVFPYQAKRLVSEMTYFVLSGI